MTLELVHTFLNWLQNHSGLAYLIIFLTALGESLALVGLLVPGAILMVLFGALIATGHLDFYPVFIAACTGAIIGDGLSYWIGKYYQQQLVNLWPFNRHPVLINKGTLFFQRHGGKSILLGRFIGPIRPIIPAVAGMLNMRFDHFAAINILSALLWAPLYLLPGILIGTSLELASELAGRFTLLLVLLLFSLWLLYKIIHFAYTKITLHTDQWLHSALNWNKRHSVLGRIGDSLLDPVQQEIRGLTLLTLLLLFSSLVVTFLFTYALKTAPVHNINLLVLNTLANIQSPPFDWLLQWLSRLADRDFIFIVVAMFSLWLAWKRSWISIIYLFSALLVPLAITIAINWTYSSTATLSTALILSVYGFITIILVRQFPTRIRFSLYIGATWLISLIGFSRLYFTTHWLTDVIAGFLLGLVWLCIIAIAYRQHHRDNAITTNKIVLTSMVIILLLTSYPYNTQHKTYSDIPFTQYYVMSDVGWRETGWQVLPFHRQDLKAKNQQPFNLQWAGSAENIITTFVANGWQQPNIQATQFAHWLNPNVAIEQLPLLPHVHDGRYDDIRLYKISTDKKTLLVLRLWQTDLIVKTPIARKKLWVGNISSVKKKKTLLASYLYTSPEFNSALNDFMATLKSSNSNLKKTIKEHGATTVASVRNGRVILLSE